jgi:hypothetical protein
MFNPLSWAVPRLRNVAISGLYWKLVTLIDVSFWLIDTTRQFMLRDAHAIALDAFAQANFFSPMIHSVDRYQLTLPCLSWWLPFSLSLKLLQ